MTFLVYRSLNSIKRMNKEGRERKRTGWGVWEYSAAPSILWRLFPLKFLKRAVRKQFLNVTGNSSDVYHRPERLLGLIEVDVSCVSLLWIAWILIYFLKAERRRNGEKTHIKKEEKIKKKGYLGEIYVQEALTFSYCMILFYHHICIFYTCQKKTIFQRQHPQAAFLERPNISSINALTNTLLIYIFQLSAYLATLCTALIPYKLIPKPFTCCYLPSLYQSVCYSLLLLDSP